jgi:hypothetical protein
MIPKSEGDIDPIISILNPLNQAIERNGGKNTLEIPISRTLENLTS